MAETEERDAKVDKDGKEKDDHELARLRETVLTFKSV
jgi:hypothetical protein